MVRTAALWSQQMPVTHSPEILQSIMPTSVRLVAPPGATASSFSGSTYMLGRPARRVFLVNVGHSDAPLVPEPNENDLDLDQRFVFNRVRARRENTPGYEDG